MSFAEVHAAHPWDEVLGSVVAKTEADVLRALARAEADSADLEDFKALISPAAAPHLERMARLSHERTLRRYGRTMQLFAPAYLSNECQNVCTYCGFSAGNKVPRRTLNPGEILREAGALKKLGFDHLLILTGESNKVEVPYFVQALDL
ncbi:MAG: 2-iminoacetate synthase ThiH, partial [Opitutales bacterium]